MDAVGFTWLSAVAAVARCAVVPVVVGSASSQTVADARAACHARTATTAATNTPLQRHHRRAHSGGLVRLVVALDGLTALDRRRPPQMPRGTPMR